MHLGVDCGGSKTTFLLVDDNMREIARAVCIGGGAAVDSNTVNESIAYCLHEFVITNNAQHRIVTACINLGGKNVNQIHKTVGEILTPKVPLVIYRESEGTIPLILARFVNSNIIILAGTGTIALGYNDDLVFVTGGWGQDIGDEGGGYWIGIQAIKFSLLAIEGRSQYTQLAERVLKYNSVFEPKKNMQDIITARDKLRSNIFPLDRRNVAAITPDVCLCADNGDEVACNILNSTGSSLAELAIHTAKSLNLVNTQINVLITGGLTNCIQYWQSSFTDGLKRELPLSQWKISEYDLAWGAAYYANNYMN
jgi:N-acetylglucosamine kinase-like BadF-type ATPase